MTRTAPLHNDIEFSQDVPTEVIDEFVMGPGDVLHVPRGCWHAVAASEGEPSLHLTCGLVTNTGADFLRWLTNRLIEHESVRADVPRTHEERQQWTTTIATLVDEALRSPEVVEEYWKHKDATDEPRPVFSLPVAVTSELTDDTVVRLASLRGSVALDDDVVTYSAQGRRWRFPAKVAPMISHLHQNGAGSVKELSELVPEAPSSAVVKLLRTLMDDGALVCEVSP
jgi:ribosomal protein L16 Arg81 hydroxylase